MLALVKRARRSVPLTAFFAAIATLCDGLQLVHLAAELSSDIFLDLADRFGVVQELENARLCASEHILDRLALLL